MRVGCVRGMAHGLVGVMVVVVWDVWVVVGEVGGVQGVHTGSPVVLCYCRSHFLLMCSVSVLLRLLLWGVGPGLGLQGGVEVGGHVHVTMGRGSVGRGPRRDVLR